MINAARNRLTARVLAGALLVTCHLWVNWRQPEPYMDELFHVPQAERFCASVLKSAAGLPHYHPAITTPPGPYLFPALASALHPAFCTIRGLRAWSALCVWLALPQIAAVLASLRSRIPTASKLLAGNDGESELQALAVLLHPPLFFYASLFYSDPPSVLALLLCLRLSLAKRHWISSLCGIAAALCRQTSAVFHGFIALDALLSSLRDAENIYNLMHVTAPHVLASLVYAALFYKNSFRVALGDHMNHTPTLHHAMFAYHAGYLAISAAPLMCFALVSYCRREAWAHHWISRASAVIGFMSALALCLTLVERTGDFVHPFALADNRHYTFYIYRRLLLRSRWLRFAFTPVYAAALIAPFVQIYDAYQRDTTAGSKRTDDSAGEVKHALQAWLVTETVSEMALLCAVAVCVVPASLLEPRYFVQGFILTVVRAIARMALSPADTRSCIMALAFTNLALIFIFCEMWFPRPADPHMPGDKSPGRFLF
jgi:alpha-1,2-glucosyltransferase